MADDKVSVNTEGMAPAVDGFKNLGDRLVQITAKLEHTLDSLGTPWGDDKNGHAFFKQYGTARDQTLTGVADMADVVHSVGQGVRQMIDAYEKVEEHNQELARKMQLRREGNGDGSGGGGGGGGSYGGGGGGGDNGPGDGKKVPLERATRRELTKQKLAEPLQPTLRREAERVTEPLEPLRPALREELQPTIPAKPVLAASTDGVPLEPTESHALLARTEAVPDRPVEDASTPLEKRQFVRSVRGEPAEFIPATQGVPAESRFSAAIPAERGEVIPETPALPVHEAFAAEQGSPLGHLMQREGEPLLPAEKGIPAEPLHRVEGHVTLPRHESVPAEPLHRVEGVVTPESRVHAPHLMSRLAEGEVTLPRHEGVPVEPLHRAEGVVTPESRVHAPHVMSRLAETPVETTLPRHRSEPVGFAELEPETFVLAEPAIPAEPEIPAEPAK
jgi:hypothetical protein